MTKSDCCFPPQKGNLAGVQHCSEVRPDYALKTANSLCAFWIHLELIKIGAIHTFALDEIGKESIYGGKTRMLKSPNRFQNVSRI